MDEREQIQLVCRWNRDLSRENRELRVAVKEGEEVASKTGIERDTALVFLDSAWRAAAEGEQP
jgi:hypothetical protein